MARNGTCIQCGKPTTKGPKCAACYERNRRAERTAAGLCWECNTAAVPGLHLCVRHHLHYMLRDAQKPRKTERRNAKPVEQSNWVRYLRVLAGATAPNAPVPMSAADWRILERNGPKGAGYKALLERTRREEEHPEWYNGPCLCRVCVSYADVGVL